MYSNDSSKEGNRDGIPKLRRIEEFMQWMTLFIAHLATLDLSIVIQQSFHMPTHIHPSMEAPVEGQPPMQRVGQPALIAIAPNHLGDNDPGQAAQEAGMSVSVFNVMMNHYNTMQAKVYGIIILAIQGFTTLYDHIIQIPEFIAMQSQRLRGSRIWTFVHNYCTANPNDALAGVIIAQLQSLRLLQFSTVTQLIKAFNEFYHVLPLRMAYSDAMKKLQLQTACGETHKQFIQITSTICDYPELCNRLTNIEIVEQAANALAGQKSERSVLKNKASEESDSEAAMSSVDDNTQKNRDSLGVRFKKRFASNKIDDATHANPRWTSRNLSRSSSSSPQRKHSRTLEANRSYHQDRRSRSPSPYSNHRRSPGRDRRHFRYEDCAREWRNGGSGYRDDRSPARQRSDGDQMYAGITCFKCGAPGHKSNACPEGSSSYSSSQIKCFKCGRSGHKAIACRAVDR